jgi:hypothetical protein
MHRGVTHDREDTMPRQHIPMRARLLGAAFAACALAPVTADLQGWNGPGWYVTGSAPLAPKSPATPAYILFHGPHDSGSACALVHDRLYSPIGVCRLLDIKPGT